MISVEGRDLDRAAETSIRRRHGKDKSHRSHEEGRQRAPEIPAQPLSTSIMSAALHAAGTSRSSNS